MTEKNQEIKTLLGKFLQDRLSQEELDRLRSLVGDPANDAVTSEWIGDAIATWDHVDSSLPVRESIFTNVLDQSEKIRKELLTADARTTAPAPVRTIYKRRWWAVAAALLLVASVGMLIVVNKAKTTQVTARQNMQIPPGKNGAILTLADGTHVVLDSLGNEWGATQNGAKLSLHNGQLAYAADASTSEALTYNTMTVPKGRQFKLSLPDGTLVWLNAGSSLRYPTAFTGKERNVEMTGEAYFEVAKNATQPFKVSAPGIGEIEVLGTSFNVNSYDDEPIAKTTLLTGAIKLGSGQQQERLTPGQQARRYASGEIQVTDKADLEQVMAWKNGMFNFNGSDIRTVLRQISRWYDIDVVYASEPENTLVSGEMQRNLSLNTVMDILKDLDIKYTLDGRKMIISK